MLHSNLAFLGLVRSGAVHAIFDALFTRLGDEETQFTLAGELEQEDEEEHQSESENAHTRQTHAWIDDRGVGVLILLCVSFLPA